MSMQSDKMVTASENITWFKAAKVSQFPVEGGACVKYKDEQIAVFNFTSMDKWFACQNQCPHKMQMILSRGMIGDLNGEPKVACPFHKKQFSLESGECLDDESCGTLKTYPVKVENGEVFIGIEE